MIIALDHFRRIIRLTHFQLNTQRENLRAAIQGNQEILIPALHPQRNRIGIGDNQRTDIQRMRSDRTQHQAIALRHDNRPVHAHGISRRAGGRSDNQAIRLIGSQILIVQKRMNRNHR